MIPFTVPADSVAKVHCLADVTLPIPPVVTNNCSTNIEPVLTRSDTTFNDCQGTVVFTFTYNDCTLDHAKNWKMTYQIKDTIKPEKVGHLQELARKVNEEKMGKPSFLMVLTGGEYAYQRKDGVLVVPIGCLKD